MEKRTVAEEKTGLEVLIKMEELLEKKAKIYSRLLISPSLAKEMEGLSVRHGERKKELRALAMERQPKEKEEEE